MYGYDDDDGARRRRVPRALRGRVKNKERIPVENLAVGALGAFGMNEATPTNNASGMSDFVDNVDDIMQASDIVDNVDNAADAIDILDWFF